MLSILIPVYNYDVRPLVLELHKQCLECGIEFEILVQDDASKSLKSIENQQINDLKYCSYFENSTNLGRGKNINLLAFRSKFEWLLILDCDMMPTSTQYISNYLEACVNSNSKLFFGGISYNKDEANFGNLRYVYGIKRESLSLEARILKHNFGALTSNLLVRKALFLENKFNEKIHNYGFEDILFLYNLQLKQEFVHHLCNPLLHLNLENSQVFMDKMKYSMQNLKFIIDQNPNIIPYIKLADTFSILKKMRLHNVVYRIYALFEKDIKRNLTSKKPNLILFDIYKLCNFIKLYR